MDYVINTTTERMNSTVGLYTKGRTHFDLRYIPAKETVRLYLEKMIP